MKLTYLFLLITFLHTVKAWFLSTEGDAEIEHEKDETEKVVVPPIGKPLVPLIYSKTHKPGSFSPFNPSVSKELLHSAQNNGGNGNDIPDDLETRVANIATRIKNNSLKLEGVMSKTSQLVDFFQQAMNDSRAKSSLAKAQINIVDKEEPELPKTGDSDDYLSLVDFTDFDRRKINISAYSPEFMVLLDSASNDLLKDRILYYFTRIVTVDQNVRSTLDYNLAEAELKSLLKLVDMEIEFAEKKELAVISYLGIKGDPKKDDESEEDEPAELSDEEKSITKTKVPGKKKKMIKKLKDRLKSLMKNRKNNN